MMNDTKSFAQILDQEEYRQLALQVLLPELTKNSHLFRLSEAVGWTKSLQIMGKLGGKRAWIPKMVFFSQRTIYTAAALLNIYRRAMSFEEAVEMFRLPLAALRSAIDTLNKYQKLAESSRAVQSPSAPASHS